MSIVAQPLVYGRADGIETQEQAMGGGLVRRHFDVWCDGGFALAGGATDRRARGDDRSAIGDVRDVYGFGRALPQNAPG